MSQILDRIVAQAVTMTEDTVTLSPESVTVLLFAISFLENKRSWLETNENPMDEVTDEDWDTIEKLIANLSYEVMSPVSLAIVGEIRMFGLDTPPAGWLACDGVPVPIADYPALYDAIGINFGLTAGGNFQIPDLRFRSPVGIGASSDDPAYEIILGQKGGSIEIALSTNELPTHTHQEYAANAAGGTAWGVTRTANWQGQFLTNTITGSAGNGQPFPIIPPVIGLLACIYSGII